jgi:hypothetical protein
MDLDPIRRSCYDGFSGDLREDVCDWDGTAGLLLPVAVPPAYTRNQEPGSGATRECRPGKFFWKQAATIGGVEICADASRPVYGRCLVPHSGTCEDGTTPCGLDAHCAGIGTGVCIFRAGCINQPDNGSIRTPWRCADMVTACTVDSRCTYIGDGICRRVDTRSFNLQLRDGEPHVDYQTGGQMVLDGNGRVVSSAFFRSHELHPAAAGAARCAESSSEAQIDCLVNASACTTSLALRGDPHPQGIVELALCADPTLSPP